MIARIISGLILFLVVIGLTVVAVPRTEAACGAVSCFIVIGSQQQIPQKGLLTMNIFYSFTPMSQVEGTSAVIPAVDQDRRLLILDHHREVRSITQTATLDLN